MGRDAHGTGAQEGEELPQGRHCSRWLVCNVSALGLWAAER